jgi:microcystin-dependent protein
MKRQSFLLSGAGAMLAGCAASVVPPGASNAPGTQPATPANLKSNLDGGQLLGSLLLVPYDYAPKEFLESNGRLMQIERNTALFSLLGTRFGGDGKKTFGLPDMTGKEPIDGLMYVIAIDGNFPRRPLSASANSAPALLGQLLLVSFLPQYVPPRGWAVCDGKLLDIKSNQALNAVMGSKFGGDGKTTFALPDLRKHAPAKGLTYLIALQGRFPSHT